MWSVGEGYEGHKTFGEIMDYYKNGQASDL